MKLTTFFISETKQNYAKTITVPESMFRIKVMLPSTLFEIALTLAVICKKRFLHKNEIVQYLPNYSYQDMNQDHFKKGPLSFYKCHEKQLPSDSLDISHEHFSFKLLFSFKFL